MNLVVNGKDYHDLPEGMTVGALLDHLTLPRKKIAVERNMEIVSKSKFDDAVLCEGDRLEIIHFIGGG
ncbi:MAG: sulfur carrier protein ThiS [Hellea sp.]|nr:sulfur carrier protein ThiS [Hellea sp.]